MLQEETLGQIGKRQYEEPDGEFLELITTGRNTITVLTRVEDTGKVEKVEEEPEKPRIESPPVDPTDMTVSELKEALEDSDYDWNNAALQGLLEAEQDGKNRKTAVEAISEKLE